MRFLMMIKINEAGYEAGLAPPPALEAAMGKLMAEWGGKGVLLSAEGLRPTSAGARIRLDQGTMSVIDGPFTEAKEVIGGFAIVAAGSKAEAIEHARRFVDLHRQILGPSYSCECEVRQIEG